MKQELLASQLWGKIIKAETKQIKEETKRLSEEGEHRMAQIQLEPSILVKLLEKLEK